MHIELRWLDLVAVVIVANTGVLPLGAAVSTAVPMVISRTVEPKIRAMPTGGLPLINPLQGYGQVPANAADKAKGLGWGFTIGSGTVMYNAGPATPLNAIGLTLGEHEFGHGVQMLALSALRSKLPLGAWIPYGLVGGIGILGERGLLPGCGVEWLADMLGGPGHGFDVCRER